MDDVKTKLKEVFESSEFDQHICQSLVESLKKDLTKLYIAANTQNNKDFHVHYDTAMERVFALSERLK